MEKEKLNIDGCVGREVESKGKYDKVIHKIFENYSSLQTGNADINYDVSNYNAELVEICNMFNEKIIHDPLAKNYEVLELWIKLKNRLNANQRGIAKTVLSGSKNPLSIYMLESLKEF